MFFSGLKPIKALFINNPSINAEVIQNVCIIGLQPKINYISE